MQSLCAALFCGLVIYIAIEDFRTRTISDSLCIVLALTGLPYVNFERCITAAGVALISFVLWKIHRFGGGDCWLCTAASFTLGAPRMVAATIISLIIESLYVFCVIICAKLRRRPIPKSYPLAPFLTAGFLPAYFIL